MVSYSSNFFGASIDTSEITDGAVTFAKLNPDIVGIDTTTGKINDINSTNFKSLDGNNLTGTSAMRKLGQTVLGAEASSMSVDSLTLTDYTRILIVWSGKKTTADGVLWMRLNDDSGANYDNAYVTLNADSHVTSSGDGHAIVGGLNLASSGGFIILNVDSTLEKIYSYVGGGGAKATSGSGVWDISPVAVTKISLVASANNLTAGSKMTVYGIVD